MEVNLFTDNTYLKNVSWGLSSSTIFAHKLGCFPRKSYFYIIIFPAVAMRECQVLLFDFIRLMGCISRCLSAHLSLCVTEALGGGPRVVVSTAAFHARVRGSVPGLGGLKETKMFLPHPRVKVSIVGSLRDREVACSASDRQGSNFESCVWRTVSSQSSHHPQEVLLAQFSLYVHKGGLKPDSFHLQRR